MRKIRIDGGRPTARTPCTGRSWCPVATVMDRLDAIAGIFLGATLLATVMANGVRAEAAPGAVALMSRDAPAETSDAPEPPVDMNRFVETIRGIYVDQFRMFIEEQKARGAQGVPEVRVEVAEPGIVFRRLYCADFLMTTAGGREPIVFQPESQYAFEPFTTRIGALDVTFRSFGWDGIEIRYDSASSVEELIGPWHDRWFVPNDQQDVVEPGLGGGIHSVVVAADRISVDMGTAPVDAFWELLEAFDAAGVARLEIGSDDGGAAGEPAR